MARFMDVHNGFVGVTAEQLREAGEQRDLPVETTSPSGRWTPGRPRADQLLGEQSR